MAARPADASERDYAYCGTLLRRDDPDRWLASLFVPEAKRPHIHALYAFSLEIARVREIVSEPLLGEIRHQWWRDALEAPDGSAASANPVAAALLDTIARFSLPKAALLELLDARLFDLYDDPMESIDALEAYARATSSGLFRFAPMILDQEEPVDGLEHIPLRSTRSERQEYAQAFDSEAISFRPNESIRSESALGAAEHAGIAYAVTGILRALPWHCARGQIYVPLELLRAHGADREDFLAGRTTPGVMAALADLRALARRHLDIFGARLPGLPDKSRPAFLPASLCESYLGLMEKADYQPFQTAVALPQWRRQWSLWRASKRWA